MRRPETLGDQEVVALLTDLADRQRVARSIPVQALSALLLLYREVLRQPLGDIRAVIRSTTPTRLSVVLTRQRGGWAFGVAHRRCVAHRAAVARVSDFGLASA